MNFHIHLLLKNQKKHILNKITKQAQRKLI